MNNLTGETDRDGRIYQYTYNADDNGTTGLPQVTLTYGYDNKGNETSLDGSKGCLT